MCSTRLAPFALVYLATRAACVSPATLHRIYVIGTANVLPWTRHVRHVTELVVLVTRPNHSQSIQKLSGRVKCEVRRGGRVGGDDGTLLGARRRRCMSRGSVRGRIERSRTQQIHPKSRQDGQGVRGRKGESPPTGRDNIEGKKRKLLLQEDVESPRPAAVHLYASVNGS